MQQSQLWHSFSQHHHRRNSTLIEDIRTPEVHENPYGKVTHREMTQHLMQGRQPEEIVITKHSLPTIYTTTYNVNTFLRSFECGIDVTFIRKHSFSTMLVLLFLHPKASIHSSPA
ncbi:hypothetical protein OCU04_001071 [Sclerotinia nivalis]|uniref:Uncharacterized protein n=1 Tax=Sclerotinia nivalis TaxID=352851 RepID=A0A9X0AXD5_9HELO|nr:hypothetical protein OCU04_001071 [Sclerotinia nivalis]